MAERITVSTQEMLDTLNVYSAQKGAQATAFGNMNSAVNNLSSTWSGSAFEEFRQKFTQFYNNIKQSEEKMQDAVDELRQSSDIFQSAEEKNKAGASNLDIGSSPFSG